MTHAKQSPRRWGTRLGLPLVVLAVLVVAALALALSRPSGDTPLRTLLPPQFLSPLRTDATPIHIRLSGQDYLVPVNYLDSPLDPGLDQDALLLVALLPDLEARTQENWDEFLRVPGWGRRVYMLVMPRPFPVDILDRYLETDRSNFGPFEDIGDHHGLQHLRSISGGGFLGRRDIFVNMVEETLNGIITCTFEEDYPSPGCSHEFTHDNLLFKISYDRSNLTQWRSIEESIRSLFDEFARAPSAE